METTKEVLEVSDVSTSVHVIAVTVEARDFIAKSTREREQRVRLWEVEEKARLMEGAGCDSKLDKDLLDDECADLLISSISLPTHVLIRFHCAAKVMSVWLKIHDSLAALRADVNAGMQPTFKKVEGHDE
ncbi:hypothetical protein PoB_000305700, partial [Plakobranchus ocellatus]